MTDLAEQWVNIYKSKKHGSYWTGAFCYKTKEEAVKDLADKENYLTTVNIEDMLQKTENVAKNVANKNLQDLTEQWKKGAPSYQWVIDHSFKPFSQRLFEKTLEDNKKLKELLKECELWFTGIVGNMNDKNVGEHNRNLPIGNFEYIFKEFSQKIDEVLK
jgi:hypothetical protein